MKKIIQQSIAVITLCAIALFAGSVSAKPAVTAPCTTGDQTCVSTTNPSLPVGVGGISQIKQGDLAVGWFISKLNAAFDGSVDVEGIVTGGDTANSTLKIGDATLAKPVIVSADIQGATYVQGGSLYTNTSVAPTGQSKALCATQKGDIIFCDGSSVSGSSTPNPNPNGTGGTGGTTGGGTGPGPLTVSSFSVVSRGNQVADCTVNLSSPAPSGQSVTATVRINYNVVSPPGAPGVQRCGVTIGLGESTSSTTVVLTSGTTYSSVTGYCVESSSVPINPSIKC
jgi:hypothetical protein